MKCKKLLAFVPGLTFETRLILKPEIAYNVTELGEVLAS
jgi:hypothetical protein